MPEFWQQNESGVRLISGVATRARALLRRTSRIIGVTFAEVGVVYVTSAVSRSLNRRYRKHDWVTDVLSFTYHVKPVAGELVICLSQASRQAKRAKTTLRVELERLLVHGFLHLAGYDHMKPTERKVMRALEDRILNV